MASPRRRRERVADSRRGRRLAASSLGAATLLLAAPGLADTRVIPSDEGYLGAWLISGPYPSSFVADRRVGAPRDLAGPRPRFIANGDGPVDLRRALATGENDRAVALVGGLLELSEPLEGWLLLSVDGRATASVGGEVVYEQPAERMRAGAWDAVPLTLGAGTHWLLFQLTQTGRDWGLEARILDARDLLPPRGLRVILPGVDEGPLTSALLSTRCSAGLDSAGYRPEVEAAFRRGAPDGAPPPLEVRLDLGASRSEHRAGAPARGRGALGLSARFPSIPASALPAVGTRPLAIELVLGGVRRRCELELSRSAPEVLARADRVARALADEPTRPNLEVAEATLALARNRLLEDPRTFGGQTLRSLEATTAKLERGVDLVHERGVIELARRSDLDGRPQSLLVHVPSSHLPGTTRRYPLVLLLHGYNGTPTSVMRAFLDGGGSEPRADIEGFVVAPQAHDNTFYRGPGEHEVLRTLDWALATYPIDPERVSVAGVSMGGTGAAHVALRHPGRFAAAAPLCGYQSYFVRRDLRGLPARSWEVSLMEHWSPASFAANGRALPMYVAQGTEDKPLENSRVLARAYRARGYPLIEEWPEAKHDVWRTVWAGRKQWAWFARQRRQAEPSRVTLVTDQLRYGELDWVRITELSRSGTMGSVDASVAGRRRIEVRTDGVRAFELELRSSQLDAGPIQLSIDGVVLEAPAPGIAAFVRVGGDWQPGRPDAGARSKRAGLEGPIHDLFLGPVVVAYGSGLASTARANREIAQRLARGRDGANVEYPVLADVEVDDRLASRVALVLVGTPRDNALLARIDGRLPLRIDGDAIVAGDRRFTGRDVGAIFVYPNPEHPERYVLVVEAPTLGGLYRSLSLPKLLPDFVVFDARLAPASGRHILGRATVQAAGFFQNDWSLPDRLEDEVARRL